VGAPTSHNEIGGDLMSREYGVVMGWLREQVEGGGTWVTSMVLSPIDRARDFYGEVKPDEYMAEAVRDAEMRGATHVIRFSIGEEGVELVDGDEWFLDLSSGEVKLLSEPDLPQFHGGHFEDSLHWVSQLALLYF
jgi:hypothetical protein